MSRETSSITTLLEEIRPRSILVIGPHVPRTLARYQEADSECRIDHLAGRGSSQRLDTLGMYDLVFVSGVIENMDKSEAGVLLAKLRDLHARRLIVAVSSDQRKTRAHRWQETDLLAYGLHLRARHTGEDKPIQLFEFDISNYKTTPDWLNSKYWAHPELFDKYRW